LIDRHGVVGNEAFEGVGNLIEEGIEALFGEKVAEETS
jgi:hypothetical protein